MGVTTGFHSMGPLYICQNCFTISTTAFSPNKFIPAFSDICVNILFVATFINESVLSVDYCSLINNLFPGLYVFPSNDSTICTGVLYFWYVFRIPQKFIACFFWKHIYLFIFKLDTSCSFWKHLDFLFFVNREHRCIYLLFSNIV